MKIFNSHQIRDWDNYTIQHEGITSLELMERAATACFSWLSAHFSNDRNFIIFCGRGNNGGDGLAIARIMVQNGFKVSTCVLAAQNYGSSDFESNLAALKSISEISFLHVTDNLPEIEAGTIIIDALFGTGLKKPLSGLSERIAGLVNKSNNIVVSIDMPSGLFADQPSGNNTIIKATYTLTFQQVKFAFMFPENTSYIGKVIVLPIGLSQGYYLSAKSDYNYITPEIINKIYKVRDAEGHKGTYGQALIIAGSFGMMGAAILATKAALRTGAGKVLAAIPKSAYKLLQISVPEAISKIRNKKGEEGIDLKNIQSIGVGPGIGNNISEIEMLTKLFKDTTSPLVIDADALNILAENKVLLNAVPFNSILTPHPKEFQRLFGKTENDLERIELAIKKAKEFKVYIILKSHHTCIVCPDDVLYFNSTGNPGMATAGSGDVLTGIITGLLAQQYDPLEAAILGVYIHGLAGDIAAGVRSEESLIASDIIENLGKAFLKLKAFKEGTY